jgi:pentatricopeptide repeat protein
MHALLLVISIRVGKLKRARYHFDSIRWPNAETYTAMIQAYADHGQPEQIDELVGKLERDHRVTNKTMVLKTVADVLEKSSLSDKAHSIDRIKALLEQEQQTWQSKIAASLEDLKSIPRVDTITKRRDDAKNGYFFRE